MSALLMKDLLEKKLNFVIRFKNLTSGTAVESSVTMISFSNNGCSLVTPVKTCAQGHQVLLRFLFEAPPKTKSNAKAIEITGNIIDMLPINEKSNEVNIQFIQYVKEEWQSIIDKFDRYQDEISGLVSKLKDINE